MALSTLAFIDGLGGPEMVLVFVVVLLLFGGQKLPEFARGLGKTMREFKKAAAGVEDEFKRALEEDERKKSDAALAAATPVAALPAGQAADAATPEHDPYHDHAEPDYHDGDYYSEAGPEAPAAIADTPPEEPASGTPAAAAAPAADAGPDPSPATPAQEPAPASTPDDDDRRKSAPQPGTP